jgi:L-threonylcarbamoyladenylate synthase
VALRVPAHPLAQALLAATALPIAGPSANLAGTISATTADHVARMPGQRIEAILDGGACPIGLESTVLDLSGPAPRLLRPGGLVRSAIEAEIGPLAVASAIAGGDGPALSPGQQASHYAPERPVRLDATTAAADEALLAFGPRPPNGAAITLNLSPSGDLEEAAANLFAMLRALDRPEVRAIAVMPVPGRDLGEAIRDRLVRAAAPRPMPLP